MPVLLALLSAPASSVDLVLQRDSSRAVPAHVRGRRLAGYLVRDRRWLTGQAAWVAAFALQALALHVGPWSTTGLASMLTDWPVYALVAVGAVSTMLVRTAGP
jgi:hypothetical protein